MRHVQALKFRFLGDLLSGRPPDSARAGVWVSPHWLWRVTHLYTPCFPSLFPFTLTHLDGRDRGGGNGGNLGASRRGGTTELVNETRTDTPLPLPLSLSLARPFTVIW